MSRFSGRLSLRLETVELMSTPHLRMTLVTVSSVVRWLTEMWSLAMEFALPGASILYPKGKAKQQLRSKRRLISRRALSDWRGAEGQSLQIGICRSAAGLHESSVALTLCPCFATPQSGQDRAIGVPLPGFSSTSAIQSLCCAIVFWKQLRCVV